jgi:hypothetical protein
MSTKYSRKEGRASSSSSATAETNSKGMEALIPVINQLQDVFNTVGEAKVRDYHLLCVVVSPPFFTFLPAFLH